MSAGLLGIGVSGLNAAQAGVSTTSHNIANANTTGFHRQYVVQSALIPLLTGGGYFGQGVKVDTIQRAYNQLIETQLTNAQAQESYYNTYHTQLSQINNIIADPTTGISPTLQDFFQSVQSVGVTPADSAARQSMLSSGGALVASFNTLAARFDEQRSGVNSQVSTLVGQINSYAQEIARLNVGVITAQVNPTQPPNDLLDQRDAAIAALNQLVNTSVIPQTDGSVNVLIGNGQNLVIAGQTLTLVAVPLPDHPQSLTVGYQTGGSTALFNQSSISGGQLGALLAFRTNELDPAQNSLGQVAAGLALTFNNQHRLGQDLNGALGGNFFSVPVPTVQGKTTNTGTAVVTAAITNAAPLTSSDYQVSATVVLGVPTYTITRLSDNTSSSYAALPQTVDGVTFTLASGAFANGDSFLVQPTRNAARDIDMALTTPAGIAAAAPIRTAAASANAGSATINAGTVNGPPPPNANLQQPVTITFTSPTTFNVTGVGTANPVGVPYTSGGNITYNGWTVQISGTPAAGDVFTVSSNTGGVSDGRNAVLLANLQTQNTLSNGTTTYQGGYNQLVNVVGSHTKQAEVTAAAQSTLADQALQAQQSLSGVNLDEEAANLLRYQQAYQASAKAIQIAATLFDTILNLGK